MQIGDYTQPGAISMESGTFSNSRETVSHGESDAGKPRRTSSKSQRRYETNVKQILNAALLEIAMNEAKIVNHLATNMLNNPGNLGLRPAAEGCSACFNADSGTALATSSPVTVEPLRLSCEIKFTPQILAD